MKVQRIKTNNIGNNENLKPYIVVGVGVLVVAISVYQLLSSAPGNLLQSRGDNKASQEVANPGSTRQDKESLVVENIDSDSDGLTDTEEERIYHTDPLKPDTDGDGYRDGDEVKTGHDPLTNENGSKGNASTTADASSQEYNRFIATNPDDLSKIDPTKYLDSNTIQDISSGNPSDQSIDKLASLALSNVAISQTQVLPTIPDSAINISSASGKQAVQQYLFSLGSVLLQYAPFSDQKEMVTYITAAANGDTAKTQSLINMAKSSEAQIKTIPVPAELVDIHKKAIGVMQLFQKSAAVLANAENVDSTSGMTATNQLRIIANAVDDLATTLTDIMKKYGISDISF